MAIGLNRNRYTAETDTGKAPTQVASVIPVSAQAAQYPAVAAPATPTRQSVAAGQYGSGIQYAQPGGVQQRGLMDASSLAKQYGNINYDQDAIQRILGNAVNAKYDALEKDYARSAGQYSNRLAQSQNSYLDAMRKANAESVMSGASQAMNRANQLSAILGMSQQTSADATSLAQQQRALADQHQSEMAATQQQALEYANAQKLALGSLGSNIYATDAGLTQAEIAARAQLQAANVGASAQGYSAELGLQGTDLSSSRALEGSIYGADKSYQATDLSSGRSLQAARESNQNALAVADLTSGRQLAGINAQVAGQQNVANIQAALGRESIAATSADNALAQLSQIQQNRMSNTASIISNAQEGQSVAGLLTHFFEFSNDPQYASDLTTMLARGQK